jgi:hypothetical protein
MQGRPGRFGDFSAAKKLSGPRRRSRSVTNARRTPLAEWGSADRRFCARFDCRLTRRSVRLWGEHGTPRAGNMRDFSGVPHGEAWGSEAHLHEQTGGLRLCAGFLIPRYDTPLRCCGHRGRARRQRSSSRGTAERAVAGK